MQADSAMKHKNGNIQPKIAAVNVHADTLKGLHEILEYVKGDKSKARTMVVAKKQPHTNHPFDWVTDIGLSYMRSIHSTS